MTKAPPDQGTTVSQEEFNRRFDEALAQYEARHKRRKPRATNLLAQHAYVAEHRLRDANTDPRWRRHYQRTVRSHRAVVRQRLAEQRRYLVSAPPRVAAARASHRTRPGHRRSGASSATSSADPPPPSGELRLVSDSLAAELDRIAERLRARGGVG